MAAAESPRARSGDLARGLSGAYDTHPRHAADVAKREHEGRDRLTHPEHLSMTIPSFLLGREPGRSRVNGGEPADSRWDIGPPPWRCPDVDPDECVMLVDAVDTTWSSAAAFDGGERAPGYLNQIDVGTVLVHRPIDPTIPPGERPWQAGRVHLDGIRWEEKTWPNEDFIAFRDHVASLMEYTVPGDERPQSRNLPVVSDTPPAGRDVA